MTIDNIADKQNDKKHTYQEYYEMGLRIAEEDEEQEIDSSGNKKK